MAKLIIKFNDVVIGQIVVAQGDMTIGRQPGSEIFLDNLAVSARHANIFTVGEDSFVQDLGSTNGTFINNRRIAKAHLKSGDAVAVGKHSLIYVTEDTTHSVSGPARTVVPRPDHPQDAYLPPSSATPPPAAPAPDKRQGTLFVLNGSNSGKRIELTKAVINLGRAGKKAGVISRNHSGGYTLFPADLGETPQLNGVAVTVRGQELKNGDIIEIAGSRMQFNLR